MGNTQTRISCIAKLQENVLQWKQRLQCEQSKIESTPLLVMAKLRASLDSIGRAAFHPWRKAVRSLTTR